MRGTRHIEPGPPEIQLNLPKSLRGVKTYATYAKTSPNHTRTILPGDGDSDESLCLDISVVVGMRMKGVQRHGYPSWSEKEKALLRIIEEGL